MKPYYLALVGKQMFGIRKECVAGVGLRNDKQLRPIEENGCKYLPLAKGKRALICDLEEAMNLHRSKGKKAKRGYYLILTYSGEYVALTMTDKGRLVSLDDEKVEVLPPAFSGKPREIIPGIISNFQDLILILDLDTLMVIPQWLSGERGCQQEGGQTTPGVKEIAS